MCDLTPPIPVPFSEPESPFVKVRLSDLQHIRDSLARLPQRLAPSGNLIRHLYAQVAQLHQNALNAYNKSVKEKASCHPEMQS